MSMPTQMKAVVAKGKETGQGDASRAPQRLAATQSSFKGKTQDKLKQGLEGCAVGVQSSFSQSPGFPGAGTGATGTFQSPPFRSVSVCEVPHSRLSPLPLS